jgi:hypothetical protein
MNTNVEWCGMRSITTVDNGSTEWVDGGGSLLDLIVPAFRAPDNPFGGISDPDIGCHATRIVSGREIGVGDASHGSFIGQSQLSGRFKKSWRPRPVVMKYVGRAGVEELGM